MSKIVWKGGALTAPVPPCMVTCGGGDKANIITIAWTGIVNTIPPKTYISVRPSRHSYKLIKEHFRNDVVLVPDIVLYDGIYEKKKTKCIK